MTNQPLVSIITPSYNQAAYLEYTLQSVLQQEYTPIEYLVIDGNSTDGSQEIIQRYAHRLAWWVSEPDSGQSEAINKGFRRAKGEIIAWVNSDDLLLPGAVQEAVAALQTQTNVSMVFSDALTIDAHGQPINRFDFRKALGIKPNAPVDYLSLFLRFRIICQPAVFIRRQALEQTSLLDPSYHFMLDHHLWIRLASIAPALYVPEQLWAAARHHPAAKNTTQAAAFSQEILRLLDWIQNQPQLAPVVKQIRPQIYGGAYRLSARYLLDGGMPRSALHSYWQAFRLWPAFALKHSHRILYALLCLAGWDRPIALLRHRQAGRQSRQLRKQLRQTPLSGWPGISLSPDE